MRWLVGLLTGVAIGLYANDVIAFPDGAPWGAADPKSPKACTSCHFDSDPVASSQAITMTGWPARLASATAVGLTIQFTEPNAEIVGFEIASGSGAFALGQRGVEVLGPAARSVVPIVNDDGVSWQLNWQTSEPIEVLIVFLVAVLAANNDESPFGDTVHFRSFTFAAVE